MSCKYLALAFSLTFGPVLHVLAVVFAFLKFTKFLLWVFRPITFFITLHIIVNLWQGSTMNRALVMITQCKVIMLFCLEEIMNKIWVGLVILGTVLMLQDLIWRKHSLEYLFNFILFKRFFLAKPQPGTYFMNSVDEDINTSVTIIPSIEILGPITRSRAQQLNYQVNSFLCSSAYNIESWLLPNNLIVLRNHGEDHGEQTEHREGARELRRRAREGGEPIQFRIVEFESNLESRTTSYSNWRPDCILPPFWMFYICTESKGDNLSNETSLM
jgi:hypothetical protein